MVSDNFVGWFYGADYEKVVPLLRILSFLILDIGISNVTGMQYLIPTRRQKLFTLTVISGAFTNFAINMVLISMYGAIGTAIGSVVAETVVTVAQILAVRNELKTVVIIKEGIHYYIAGAIMAFALYFINKGLTSSVINTSYIIVCGAIVYGSCLLLMKDEFLFSIMRRGSKY